MKKIQFNFSVLVGLALNGLGAIILQKDTAGLGLVITGSILLILTFISKNSANKVLMNNQHNAH